MLKNPGTKILYIFLSIVLSACSSTNQITLNVTEPAPVFVPVDIINAGIINRNVLPIHIIKTNRVDNILFEERQYLDENGAQSSIAGLIEQLKYTNRFETIKIIKNPEPNIQEQLPLTWKTVEQICKKNHIEVIFELSFYDTKTKTEFKTERFEFKNPGGIKIPVIEHHAKISTSIETAWRIYDPKMKVILDEFTIKDNIISEGVGTDSVSAILAIAGRNRIVLEKSNIIGHHYASRIFPYQTEVSREYYVRGTNNFKSARQEAQTGNWESAAKLWKKEVANPKKKIAGRACFNMAVINEMNGNLNDAADWAGRSCMEYKDKEALQYLEVLNNRIIKNEQLKQETIQKFISTQK